MLNLSSGVLTGSSTLNASVNNSGGRVRPGNSTGILTITGNYTQGSAGILEIGVAGTSPGMQYDRLVVNGTANLGGTVQIVLLSGFVPASGAQFTFVQASTRTGTFATATLPGSGLSVTYLSNGVRLDKAAGTAPPRAAPPRRAKPPRRR